MFKDLFADGKLMGFTHRRDGRVFFFGTGNTTQEDLPMLFPNYKFLFLKQVHGRNVIQADSASAPPPEADGHFTSTPGLALVVQSADCVPVLLSSPKQVCAVHAGWK